MIRHIGCFIMVILLVPNAKPQNQRPALPSEATQFDFWLGKWNVHDHAGKVIGTNKIEKIAGGMGLLEHWQSASGGTGKSLNTFNPLKKQWQQFWVGGGSVLELSGGIVSGAMILSGTKKTQDGEITDRISWTPRPDGTVIQRWDVSSDGGAAWKTIFEGTYVKSR